jgi:hypothetical protein
MEESPKLNKLDAGKQRDKDITRLHVLEQNIKQTSASEPARTIFNLISYRIHGLNFKAKKQGENRFNPNDSGEWDKFTTDELLDIFRVKLRSERRISIFNEWLELVRKTGKLDSSAIINGEGSTPKTESPVSDNSIEAKITLAQEQQSEIENDLNNALLSENWGLTIETKRDKYRLPEYHIFSMAGNELGMITVATDYHNGEERSILQFVRFVQNNNDTKGDVIAIQSNMEKDKIELFAKSALVALGGRRSGVAAR